MRGTLVVSVFLLTAGFALAAPASERSSAAVERIHISASPDTLAELQDDPNIRVTYAWEEIGWIGAIVSSDRRGELEARSGVLVEDDVAWRPLCHSNGNDPKGCGGNSPPTAGFTFSCADLTCDFDSSGSSDSDGTIESYDWDFGDATTATGVTVTHTYDAEATYTVTLTVTDKVGDTDAESKDVSVGSSEGGDGETRVADQTPYGIEQVYDDPSITATSGGASVVLGHLDTGIDTDHPDLVNRIVFATHDDKNGHGTHTAGTAAADAGSDDLGIYGVAPEADIRSYRVCKPSGFCFTSDIVEAIRACTHDGSGNRVCDVITFSIGGDSKSSATIDAIDAFVDAGGIFVAAAGNDGPNMGTIDWPAAYHRTIAVAAIDDTKTVANFSSRGDDDGNCGSTNHDMDLAAAGVDVLSTWPDGTYNTISGTSMATPHVAGLALKEWGGDGATTESNIKSLVEDITHGKHATTGCDPASGEGLPHVG